MELRRQRVGHAKELARTISESLDHLWPFMPWANPENATVTAQHRRIVEVERAWERGASYDYTLFSVDGDYTVLGGASLMGRLGPHVLEIGYWLSRPAMGRGVMTVAAGALTEAGLHLVGVERTEIHTDLANAGSQAIPRRLGYDLVRIEHRRPEAPAETGQLMIWQRLAQASEA